MVAVRLWYFVFLFTTSYADSADIESRSQGSWFTPHSSFMAPQIKEEKKLAKRNVGGVDKNNATSSDLDFVAADIFVCWSGRGVEGRCSPLSDCSSLRSKVQNQNPSRQDIILSEYKGSCTPGEYCCPNDESAHGIERSTPEEKSCRLGFSGEGYCKNITDCPSVRDEIRKLEFSKRAERLAEYKTDFCSKGEVCCVSDDSPSDFEPDSPDEPTLWHKNSWLLPDTFCGQQRQRDDQGQHAWTALLRRRQVLTGRTSYVCVGALISQRYVISAAHCLVGRWVPMDAIIDQVRFGASAGGAQIQDVAVDERIVHPGYTHRRRSTYDDIALLRLGENAVFNLNVRPVCLPMYNAHYDANKPMTIVGWPETDQENNYDEIDWRSSKLTNKASIIPSNRCFASYKGYGARLKNTQVCAEAQDVNDFCERDNLLLARDDLSLFQRWYVVGLKSYDCDACRVAKLPVVYTKVLRYVSWILNNMHE